MREPTLAWWPGRIAPGSVSDAIAGNIDFLPTFVSLGGGTVRLTTDLRSHGRDIAIQGETIDLNGYTSGDRTMAII